MPYSREPKRVNLEGQKGRVVEDVWLDPRNDKYEGWEPHVQAILLDNGDLALRFCYWKRESDGSRGKFVNRAMTVFDYVIDDLREEVREHDAHIIELLMKKLTTESPFA